MTSQHEAEKRHSFTGISKPHHSVPGYNRYLKTVFVKILMTISSHSRHSAEILTSEGQISTNNHSPLPQASERSVRSAPAVPIHDVQLPATYVALYPYKPQKADELELKKGSIYIVTER